MKCIRKVTQQKYYPKKAARVLVNNVYQSEKQSFHLKPVSTKCLLQTVTKQVLLMFGIQ